MEVLTIRTTARRNGDSVYAEYHPSNPELEGVCFHAADLPIQSTVALTISGYMPKAREELLNVINDIYGEGSYV